MYKQILNPFTQQIANEILRLLDNANIPFNVDNTDYQQFKIDLKNGAELQDIDGNVMTAEQTNEFLDTLP